MNSGCKKPNKHSERVNKSVNGANFKYLSKTITHKKGLKYFKNHYLFIFDVSAHKIMLLS